MARKRKKKKRKCLHYKVQTCYLISGIVYRWAPGLSGVPDVPHAANVSFVTEGSGVGVSSEPPVSAKSLFSTLTDNRSNSVVNLNALANTNVAVNLGFDICLVDKVHVKWETILRKGTLYVEVPSGILPEGSKESLVTLLEYAEEKLRCNHVILCFRKDRSDRASLIRTFMFMGFAVVPPGDPLLPHSADIMSLVYKIESDDDFD